MTGAGQRAHACQTSAARSRVLAHPRRWRARSTLISFCRASTRPSNAVTECLRCVDTSYSVRKSNDYPRSSACTTHVEQGGRTAAKRLVSPSPYLSGRPDDHLSGWTPYMPLNSRRPTLRAGKGPARRRWTRHRLWSALSLTQPPYPRVARGAGLCCPPSRLPARRRASGGWDLQRRPAPPKRSHGPRGRDSD